MIFVLFCKVYNEQSFKGKLTFNIWIFVSIQTVRNDQMKLFQTYCTEQNKISNPCNCVICLLSDITNSRPMNLMYAALLRLFSAMHAMSVSCLDVIQDNNLLTSSK